MWKAVPEPFGVRMGAPLPLASRRVVCCRIRRKAVDGGALREEGTRVLEHAASERAEPAHAAPDGNLSAAQADAQAERAEQVRFAAALRDTLARHHVNI